MQSSSLEQSIDGEAASPADKGFSRQQADDGAPSANEPLDEFANRDENGCSTAANEATFYPLTKSNLSLLPAIEHELRRVSSCYFSIQSEQDAQSINSSQGDDIFSSTNDLLSLWLLDDDQDDTTIASAAAGSCMEAAATNHGASHAEMSTSTCPILRQDDVLSHVVTFLDLKSMAAFSETARKPNATCYRHLQLQLERAVNNQNHGRRDETAVITRLAQLDRHQAEAMLKQYSDRHVSNQNLTGSSSQNSLSHRVQSFLKEHHMMESAPDPRNLAKAALLMAVLGGAAAAALTGAEASEALVYLEQHAEFSHVLLKLGFVGSLMGAAKTMHTNHATVTENATAASDGHAESLLNAPDAPNGERVDMSSQQHATNSLAMGVQELRRVLMERSPLFRRMQAAYEHVHQIEMKTNTLHNDGGGVAPNAITLSCDESVTCVSGCFGSYVRTIRQAQTQVCSMIKDQRKARFDCLTPEEQEQLTRTFLDACRSDETFHVVKDLVQSLDVDGFYLGSDGSETCALHAAAFYGSTQVLNFLCRGISEDDSIKLTTTGSSVEAFNATPVVASQEADTDDEGADGGLCNVSRKDKNGWTAAHFCAGSNAVPALAVLDHYGAPLNVEAGNGYTPLQWAIRLQNEQIAEELRRRTGNDGNNWMSGQPLTAIANRFFAMMPMATA
ncbi:hypothetical protein MPSEU_000829200 [Mayamaea pseudoterrestris]|nr:hypothetical protein MPSEU_000829200 [Mayamaea pseudoterrestris]